MWKKKLRARCEEWVIGLMVRIMFWGGGKK
jgi:hypothetical protein